MAMVEGLGADTMPRVEGTSMVGMVISMVGMVICMVEGTVEGVVEGMVLSVGHGCMGGAEDTRGSMCILQSITQRHMHCPHPPTHSHHLPHSHRELPSHHLAF
jgi:hypothetical protein